jgi:hypothetical protein
MYKSDARRLCGGWALRGFVASGISGGWFSNSLPSTVVDWPSQKCSLLGVPTLAACTRLLGTGKSNKNDANYARWIGIAALRQPGLARVQSADHASVLMVAPKFHEDTRRDERSQRSGTEQEPEQNKNRRGPPRRDVLVARH